MKRFAVKALFLSLSAFLAFSFVTRQVFASNVVVSPSHMNGWASESVVTGAVNFVSGPAGQPLNTGSVELTSGAQGNSSADIKFVAFSQTNLANITNLDFWTFAQSSSVNYPKLVLSISTDVVQDTLMFDLPSQTNQSATKNRWQHWTSAQNGVWSSAAFGPAGSGICPDGSLANYVTCVNGFSSSSAIINGGLKFQIGPGATPDFFDGNVDAFTINSTTYDFEPDVLGVSAPTVTTTAASVIAATTATLNSSANPNSDVTTGWFRYDTVNPGATCNDTFGTRTLAPDASLGSGAVPVVYNKPIAGLAPGTLYYFCAIAANGGGKGFGSPPLTFTTLTSPTVTTNAPISASLAPTLATLSAAANPNGSATTGWFRYFATTNPGTTCDDTTGTRMPATGGLALGSGTSVKDYYSNPINPHQNLTGLSPSTQYFYCAIANNAGGNGFGQVVSFTTPAVLGEGINSDGCADAKEMGTDWRLGGLRDPNNPWDFFDVPRPALASGVVSTRDKVVSIADVITILRYIGTSHGNPIPNANGMIYDSHFNGDPNIPDGQFYDRSPSSNPNQPWRSGPPDGVVNINDAIVALAQVGTNCN